MRKQALAAAHLATLLAAFAGASAATETGMPSMPDTLRTDATEMLALEIAATGVQIYACSPRKDEPARFEWTFVAPEAELFDTAGHRIGRHYAGPTWESEDGSKVVGTLKARDAAPDAGAIPWLLLGAKSTAGTGVFGRTSSIQRVRTVGGIPPAEPCGEAQAGRTSRVAYSATYYFYEAGP